MLEHFKYNVVYSNGTRCYAIVRVSVAQRPSFSRGLAEEHVIDRDGMLHTSDSQNRQGKAVGLEAIVGRQR